MREVLVFGDAEEELCGGVYIIFLEALGAWDPLELALFLAE